MDLIAKNNFIGLDIELNKIEEIDYLKIFFKKLETIVKNTSPEKLELVANKYYNLEENIKKIMNIYARLRNKALHPKIRTTC